MCLRSVLTKPKTFMSSRAKSNKNLITFLPSSGQMPPHEFSVLLIHLLPPTSDLEASPKSEAKETQNKPKLH